VIETDRNGALHVAIAELPNSGTPRFRASIRPLSDHLRSCRALQV
jgi:hypothetical protein